MIRQITGTVCDTEPGGVVVNVAGIGYLIHTNLDLTKLAHSAPLTLHTYLAVRETALDLYGFLTRDELDVFEQLLTIPKIGPKSALEILCKADVLLIKTAVANGDPDHLTKLSGITKKTAEKIVVGLKDSWDAAAMIAITTADTAADDALIRDTIDALIALGYPQADARRAAQQLPTSITSTNEAVKLALQILNQI